MATTIQDIEYLPFDPTGTAATNKISKEQQVLTVANYRDYHYVIPRFAPFFESTLVVRIKQGNTTRVLRKGIDYLVANKFRDASLACAKPIFGSISFFDTNLSGIIELDYQTIGGVWNITEEMIAQILAEELRNPRIIAWEQIVDLPERFPIIDHEWDLVDMTGMADVKASVDSVADAILEAAGGSSNQHISDFNNPHKVSKDQVGLGLVQNFGIATTQQAIDGVSNTVYMTPARTAAAINAQAAILVNAHAVRTDNPHNTTKGQVGLGLVENYPLATNQQAIDGAINTAYMTPALTRAAINAVQSDFANHIANTNNPHGTTKTHVGLGLVQNYSPATQSEAITGTRTDRYMTPALTRAFVSNFVTNELDSHAMRTDNPHKVDKDQVGLGNVMNYGMASDIDMAQGTAIDKYVSPFNVRKKIEDYVPALISVHTLDKDNPHEVTAFQVGAYTRQEVDTRLANYYRKGEAVDDSVAWGGESHTSYRDWLMNNMQDFNALKFNGMNYQQVRADILGSVDRSFLASDFYDNNVLLKSTPFAQLNRVRVDQANANSPVVTLDRYFVVIGSNLRPASGNSSSYAVMVCMSVRQVKAAVPTMTVIPLYGAPETQTGLRIGYTWNATTESMLGVVVTNSAADGFNVVDLSGQGPNNELVPAPTDGLIAGFTQVNLGASPYMQAITAATGPTSDLATRVKTLEDLVNSITVAK